LFVTQPLSPSKAEEEASDGNESLSGDKGKIRERSLNRLFERKKREMEATKEQWKELCEGQGEIRLPDKKDEEKRRAGDQARAVIGE
jgi:hypothetical protein